MKQTIEITEHFIQVTDQSGEIFVVPKNRFPGSSVEMETDGTIRLVYHGGDFRHTRESLLEFAHGYAIINEKWVICHGRLLDVKRVCESVGIYIQNDEIIPRQIQRKFDTTGSGDVSLCDHLVNNNIFIISVHEWKAPTKIYPIQRNQHSYSQISINGIEYHENEIKKKLESYGYIQSDECFLSGEHCILVGKKIFSGEFLHQLMTYNTPTVQSKTNNVATVVGFRREDKKTVTVYSDCTIRVDTNNNKPDPEISSECENIVMYCTPEHIVLNCSGKLRKIKFSDIHIIITNFDDARICILGDGENLTEAIKIHSSIKDDVWKTIKGVWDKYSLTFDRQ